MREEGVKKKRKKKEKLRLEIRTVSKEPNTEDKQGLWYSCCQNKTRGYPGVIKIGVEFRDSVWNSHFSSRSSNSPSLKPVFLVFLSYIKGKGNSIAQITSFGSCVIRGYVICKHNGMTPRMILNKKYTVEHTAYTEFQVQEIHQQVLVTLCSAQCNIRIPVIFKGCYFK